MAMICVNGGRECDGCMACRQEEGEERGEDNSWRPLVRKKQKTSFCSKPVR